MSFVKGLSKENFANITKNYTNLYRSITNDKDYSILVLLIENQRLEEKYNYMFTNRCLEEKLLDSNFRVMKPILYESYSLNIDFNIVQNFIDVFFNHSIVQEIKQLQKIDDSIFEGNHLEIQSRLIILRALFMLVSPDKLIDINYDYHSFIESKKYIMNHPNNNKIDAAISGTFRKIDSDKKMILK